ncbi:MAG: type V CRISPR-associated endonuclease Cas1 [Erysipelotrichaceae bacterium]
MISNLDFNKKQILFYYPLRGDKLAFLNDNLVIRDGDNKIKHQSTCYRLFAIFVVGDTTITTGLIRRSKKFGFSICFFSVGMKLYEIIGNHMEGNTLLRLNQYKYESLDLGKHIIINKIDNQRQALTSIRNKTVDMTRVINDLKCYSEKLETHTDVKLLTVLGIEGSAARIYFGEVFNNYCWQGRKPRIKMDYVNSTLDIGYTILFNIVDAILNVYGFDTYYGVLHRCFYMRKSLVCDIVEPFRPIIDLQVRKSINLTQFKEEDFEKFGERYMLKWKKSPEYTMILTKAILDYKEDIFLYIQSYYRSFMKGVGPEAFPVFSLTKK